MSDGVSREEFSRNLSKLIPFAEKAKKQMQGAKVTRARKTCPECGGTIRLALLGQREHLHMACETISCFMRLME